MIYLGGSGRSLTVGGYYEIESEDGAGQVMVIDDNGYKCWLGEYFFK